MRCPRPYLRRAGSVLRTSLEMAQAQASYVVGSPVPLPLPSLHPSGLLVSQTASSGAASKHVKHVLYAWMDSSLKRLARSDAELNRAAVYPAGGRRTLALLGQLTGELSCTADVSTHVRRSPAN